MAKYALFGNPAGGGYLLDVQSDLLDDLNVRAVVGRVAKLVEI